MTAPGATDLQRGLAAYEARRWREAAERLAAADRTVPLAPADLERLAWAHGLAGQKSLLFATLERLHDENVRLGDLRGAARAAFWLGFRLFSMGETGRATGWIGSAQRLLDRAGEGCRDCVERGYLLLPEGLERLARKEPAAAKEAARRAGEIAERFADANLASLARTIEGQAMVALGERDVGLALLDEAILPASTGRLDPVPTGIVYCAVIGCCRRVWAMDRAREWSAALADWCDSQPELVEFNGTCRVYRAEILQLQGEWGKAMEEVARAVVQPSGGAAAADRAGASYQRGELFRLLGRLDAAEEAYREASRLGREPQPGLALLRLAQGRGETAATAIRQVIASAPDPLARARYLPAAVEILLATGDQAGADAAARDLEEIAGDMRNEILDAMARHARGAVLLAAGDASGAREPLRSAFATWQRVGAPYIAARIRVLVAEALAKLGDEEGAGLERDAALAVFCELDASPDIARLEARAERRPAQTFGLTPRELEVLRLVSDGRTNRAIAEALSLSERTVDRHVSNIFAKLDVATRAAATAFAYRHELVG
ncbi:MAG: LuxR C-terminal-related transcriptional regulator [Gemmatimonadales bacterium]